MRVKPFEFWHPWLFYLPVALHVAWLCLRYRRGPGFITRADPLFHRGGLSMASKYALLDNFGKGEAIAKSLLCRAHLPEQERARRVETFMKRNRVSFPIIAKPDLGQRGRGVRLLKTKRELASFLAAMRIDHIFQEYYDYPHEYGVFVVRNERLRVVSITDKRLPVVTGDGKRTVRELIDEEPVFEHRREKLYAEYDGDLDAVLAKGETRRLLFTGTHARGALFLDGSHLKTKRLEEFFAKLCPPGFNFGRFDVKARSVEQFRQGKGMKIVEVNGVDAERTEIWDPGMTLCAAYAILREQWRDLFALAKRNDGPYPSLPTLYRELRSFYDETAHVLQG